MKPETLRLHCEKAQAFRARFPQSRAARKKSACKQAKLPAKELAAAARFGGPRVKFDDTDEWSSMVNQVFDAKGIPARRVAEKWVLEQRRMVARNAAFMTANRIFSTINAHLKDVLLMSRRLVPTKPTVVVVLDLGWKRSTRAHDAIRDRSSFVHPKGDEVGYLWGQKFGQFQFGKDSAVPLLLTWMDTLVDDLDTYRPLTYASWAGVRNVFQDRESIYAAAVQFLDQIMEASKRRSHINVKLVVAHGQDVSMEALQDVVHCRYEELEAAVKSRVMRVRVSKRTPATDVDN